MTVYTSTNILPCIFFSFMKTVLVTLYIIMLMFCLV